MYHDTGTINKIFYKTTLVVENFEVLLRGESGVKHENIRQ